MRGSCAPGLVPSCMYLHLVILKGSSQSVLHNINVRGGVFPQGLIVNHL